MKPKPGLDETRSQGGGRAVIMFKTHRNSQSGRGQAVIMFKSPNIQAARPRQSFNLTQLNRNLQVGQSHFNSHGNLQYAKGQAIIFKITCLQYLYSSKNATPSSSLPRPPSQHHPATTNNDTPPTAHLPDNEMSGNLTSSNPLPT